MESRILMANCYCRISRGISTILRSATLFEKCRNSVFEIYTDEFPGNGSAADLPSGADSDILLGKVTDNVTIKTMIIVPKIATTMISEKAQGHQGKD